MAKVESFTLDHTAVKAPYVRLITTEKRARMAMKFLTMIYAWFSQTPLRLILPGCIQLNTCWHHYCAIAWMA